MQEGRTREVMGPRRGFPFSTAFKKGLRFLPRCFPRRRGTQGRNSVNVNCTERAVRWKNRRAFSNRGTAAPLVGCGDVPKRQISMKKKKKGGDECHKRQLERVPTMKGGQGESEHARKLPGKYRLKDTGCKTNEKRVLLICG